MLSNNQLSGTIPSSLTKLDRLGLLLIYQNNLTGIVPEFDFADMKICALNGHVPNSHLRGGLEAKGTVSAPSGQGPFYKSRAVKSDNQFSCPLPQGAAEYCHGVCH